MVFLRDLANQWPFTLHAEPHYEDKEICMQFVKEEDISKNWRIRIYAPMPGFVYTAMRVSVEGMPHDYTVMSKLVLGATTSPVFGPDSDCHLVQNKEWRPLNYPLTHRMLAISEDEMDLLIQHDTPVVGKVEFVAQRLDDFLEDEQNITYAFLDESTKFVAWIMTPRGSFYKPIPKDKYPLFGNIKVIPSLRRILDRDRVPWEDSAYHRPYLILHEPLLDVDICSDPQM